MTVNHIEFEVKEKEMFYNYIAENLEIYDPLDRTICNSENEQQSIKTVDLKKLLKSMPRLYNE